MRKIVRHSMDEIKLSADLKRLGEMPKSEIDTSEMPEWTEEEGHAGGSGAKSAASAKMLNCKRKQAELPLATWPGDSTIRRTPGTPLSPEAIARLEKLKDLPDEAINTVLIPEWTSEQLERSKKRRTARLAQESAELRKAS